MRNSGNTVLIVDDEEVNRMILEELLGQKYQTLSATDGAEAMQILESETPVDLVLLDIMMPNMDGYEVCKRIKASAQLKHLPVLFISALNKVEDEEFALNIGAEDFITKPFSPPIVAARVHNHLQLAQARVLLENENQKLESLVEHQVEKVIQQNQQLSQQNQRLMVAQTAIISALQAIAEIKHFDTHEHQSRIQNYLFLLADQMRSKPAYQHALSDSSIYFMCKSSTLHDIGMMLLPDKADVDQSSAQHCELGYELLRKVTADFPTDQEDSLQLAMEIVRSHHEWWDGTGFPQQLEGEQIPLAARMVALVDSYDSLTHDTTHGAALSHAEAVAKIREQSGTRFDPAIVEAFVEIESAFESVDL